MPKLQSENWQLPYFPSCRWKCAKWQKQFSDWRKTAVLVMDERERELAPIEDLEDDKDSSDDNSTKREKKNSLFVLNPMCAGKLLISTCMFWCVEPISTDCGFAKMSISHKELMFQIKKKGYSVKIHFLHRGIRWNWCPPDQGSLSKENQRSHAASQMARGSRVYGVLSPDVRKQKRITAL